MGMRSVLISNATPLATLGNHIRYIILLRPKPKMSRIYTRRSVAGMQNAHTFGNRTIFQFPGNTMCTLAAIALE
jgi:hypothetical protein